MKDIETKLSKVFEKRSRELAPNVYRLKERGLDEDQIYDQLVKMKTLKIDNFLTNAEIYYQQQPYFYDETELWWRWIDNSWQLTDDIEMSRMLDKDLGFEGQTISSQIRNNHLEAMKWYGREKKPEPSKLHWIQFKNKAFSLRKKIFYDVTPKFFFTNPIPWAVGESDETPVLDKLFKEWVGEEYIIDLYELLAYCCYQSYPIQSVVCLVGSGRNGKSSFLKILDKFIGNKNCCTTELDLITGNNSSRFETSKLYKKLVCLMGETNFGTMEKSSIIKKLAGGDKIGYEMKGKQPFDDYNYAKVIIASNSLPISKDTTEGFYRRWHIIRFPNQFPEGKDVCSIIPEQEYHNLARKIINILPELLERGSFSHQGTPDQRMHNYIEVSNPLNLFINAFCEKGEDKYILTSELYTHYLNYLQNKKSRKVMRKEFLAALEDEGYWSEKTSKIIGKNEFGGSIFKSANWIDGLCMKINVSVPIMTLFTQPIPQKKLTKEEYRNLEKMSQLEYTRKIEKPPFPLEIKPIYSKLQETRDIILSKLSSTQPKPIETLLQAFPNEENTQLVIDELIKKLLTDGDIYSPRAGFLQRLE